MGRSFNPGTQPNRRQRFAMIGKYSKSSSMGPSPISYMNRSLVSPLSTNIGLNMASTTYKHAHSKTDLLRYHWLGDSERTFNKHSYISYSHPELSKVNLAKLELVILNDFPAHYPMQIGLTDQEIAFCIFPAQNEGYNAACKDKYLVSCLHRFRS